MRKVTAAARPRWHLVLAHATDHGAAAVAQALHGRLRGPDAVAWVAPEHLALAGWSHRVAPDGRATTRLALADGRVLDDADIAVVWNRAWSLPQPRFARASAKDRDYAAAELHALVLSWLAGLRERALPDARHWPLLAPQPQPAHWRSVAARCGVAVAAGAGGSGAAAPAGTGAGAGAGIASVTVELLVAGAAAVGDAAVVGEHGAGCVRMARALALPVVAFAFDLDAAGAVRLARIDAHAAIVDGGDDDAARVAAVAALLCDVGAAAAPVAKVAAAVASTPTATPTAVSTARAAAPPTTPAPAPVMAPTAVTAPAAAPAAMALAATR